MEQITVKGLISSKYLPVFSGGLLVQVEDRLREHLLHLTRNIHLVLPRRLSLHVQSARFSWEKKERLGT